MALRAPNPDPGGEELLDRVRAICLALPEATEGGGVGNPAWRVRDENAGQPVSASRMPVTSSSVVPAGPNAKRKMRCPSAARPHGASTVVRPFAVIR